jgi:hypothetical protein
MAENQSTINPEENALQTPPAKESRLLCEICGEEPACPGKKMCVFCDRERQEQKRTQAAKERLIETNTSPQSLTGLLDGATGSIVALSKMVADIEEYNDLSLILSPLVERLETDLEKIGEVIADTLGDIKVLVCTDFIDDDGRQYVPGTFYKAILEPKEIPGETVFLQ